MTQQHEARQAKVIFKGNRGKLYLFLDASSEMSELVQRVEERLSESPNFYRDAHLWVDWGDRQPEPAEWSLLEQAVAAFGIELHRVDSRQPGGPVPKGRQTKMEQAGWEPEMATLPTVPDQKRGGGSYPALAGGGHPGAPAPDHTLYVRRTLRSGQKLWYDGHIVLLGDVHPGAEIVAGGDIVVFGKLQGVAHAGFPGDRQAVVVALQLEPMQLRIAQLISRAPDEAVRPNSPELAQIRGDQIVVRRLDE